MAECGVNRVHAVTPRAAIVTAARAHKDGGFPDQRAFALYRGAEYLGDAQLAHGRYSAQVLGVSLTLTAVVSGQRFAHHS